MEYSHCSEIEAEAHAASFEEVLDLLSAPPVLLGTQAYPFAAQARVVAGEMWLTQGDSTRHLRNAVLTAFCCGATGCFCSGTRGRCGVLDRTATLRRWPDDDA